MSDHPLFDSASRAKLETIALITARARAGSAKGDRRSRRRGTSIEFADYRDYSPGDDLRRLDWNVYARLGRPLTKLFEDEEDLSVHLLIDASASMDHGAGADVSGADGTTHKFDYARRLVAGLGYVALVSGDRLHVTALTADGAAHFGPARGRAYAPRLLAFIGGLRAGGRVDLDAALTDYAARARATGLLILVSDLMHAPGIAAALNTLAARGFEMAVLHTLSPDEIDPTLAGDVRLIDAETRAAQEVSIDPDLIARYGSHLARWREGLRAECRKRGALYLPLTTAYPWDRAILYDLRRMGVVR